MSFLARAGFFILFFIGNSFSLASSIHGQHTIMCKTKDGCFKQVNFFTAEKAAQYVEKHKNCVDPTKQPEDPKPAPSKSGNRNVR